MKILIVNRFFGGAQIPTGRMAEDVARLLVEDGHEVTALASTGTYAGAEKRARDNGTEAMQDEETKRPRDEETAEQRSEGAHARDQELKKPSDEERRPEAGSVRVEEVRVPKWMPRALAWLWFTWQARMRIPRMDWDVCVLMTDPPLLPLLAARAKATGVSVGQFFGSAVEDKRPNYRKTETPPNRATRRVAVWLMDLYPEALAASGRTTKSNPLYKWYFNKRQRALGAADLLICLGEAQKALVGSWEGRGGGFSVGRFFGRAVGTETPQHRNTATPRSQLTERVRTAVVPPWDDRGDIAVATDSTLRNLALYAGNLGEAHCFEEILAAAPHLPGDWTIRFAVRGAKLAALRAKASQIEFSHGFTRINTDRVRTAALTGRGEKLVPDDLGARTSSSDEKAADLKGHSRPQGTEDSPQANRQLEELSEAVKLTRIDTDSFSGGDPAGKSLPPENSAGSGAAVRVTGYASEEETPALLASARVHLITMSPGWEGIVVPSKLYGCIRTGRPVLFIGPENADTAREIRAHDWGLALPPGANGEEVAAAILELAARPTRAPQLENGAKKVAELIQRLATE